jgi:hypothetical protein
MLEPLREVAILQSKAPANGIGGRQIAEDIR